MTDYLGGGRSFMGLDKKIDPINDIQNIVETGYKNCSRRTYLIRIEDEEKPINKAKRLKVFRDDGVIPLLNNDNPILPVEEHRVTGRLSKLLEDCKKFSCLYIDIGFTFSGLEKLKVRQELREVFCRKAPAFYGGAFSRSQKHLGDTGLSDAQHWCKPYQDKVKGGGFHVALVVHFPCNLNAQPPLENVECIRKFESKMTEILIGVVDAPNQLLEGNWVEVSIPLGTDNKEHFGYRDGITAPVYSDQALPPDDRGYRAKHALGEILLGYKRNDGDNPYADLGMTRKKKVNIGLQTIPVEEKDKEFFNKSSFGVLRKMEQRVDQFEEWVDQQSKLTFAQDQALDLKILKKDVYFWSKEWIRSKLLGRTPNGALLTPNITIQYLKNKVIVPTVAQINLDRFHHVDSSGKKSPKDDSQGLACPFSSHIRRMNPRDDPITPFVHRPIIRRGMPYTETDSKGMSGLFLCADIEEQFEHLVGAWANNRVLGLPDDSTCKDPLIGNHEPQNNVLYLHSQANVGGEKNKVSFDEPFVITRGCAYLWFPAKSVLATLGKYTNLLS